MTSKHIKLDEIQTTEKLQPRVMINMFVVDDYAQAMNQGIPFPPIELVFDGENYWLWDGFHRLDAASAAGLPTILANIQKGTLQDAEWYALGANKNHGLRRRAEDKRKAVRLALDHPNIKATIDEQGKPNFTTVAQHCGVSVMLVGNMWWEIHPKVSEKVENLNDLDFQKKVNGKLTREDPNVKIIPELRQEIAEAPLFDHPQKVQRIAKMPEEKQRGLLDAATLDVAQDDHVFNISDNNEWYTPEQYIKAVWEVMGGIDLDPASHPIANKTVQATQIFMANDGGLSKEWPGRVFLNPPYGFSDNGNESNQSRWSHYLIEQYQKGKTTEAILLVNAVPSNKWFAPLWDYVICFTDHRIRFYDKLGELGTPTHSNCFVYLGKKEGLFDETFSQFGVVAVKRSYA